MDATFSCKHRYTLRPICAIPCNGKDDMCLNHTDEDLDFCREKISKLFLSLTLLGLILIGCCLGEIIYRWNILKNGDEVSESDSTIDESISAYFIALKTHHPYEILEPLYCKVHDENRVLQLIVLLESNFDGHDLVEIFKDIYKFEISLHEGNVIQAELCLKDCLGTNDLAMKFIEYINFGSGIRSKLKLIQIGSLIRKPINSKYKDLTLMIASMLFNVILYYLDLIKDIFFILFIRKLVNEPENNFLFHLLTGLIATICGNELFKLPLILSMKTKLDLSMRAIFVMLVALPFIPAILIYIVARLSHKKIHCPNSRSYINAKISAINHLMARMKRNENALENFPQLIIISIIIGITLSPTTPITALKTIIDPHNPILYITAFVSFITIIRASLGQVKASLKGFLPFKGLLLYCGFIMISVGSRLLATFLYMGPTLGLLPILWHWHFGKIKVPARMLNKSLVYAEINDKILTFDDTWKVTPNLIDYTFFTYEYYVLILIALASLQIIITFLMKGRTNNGENLDIFGQALDSLLSPAIHGVVNVAIFAIGNLILMIPMWILRHNIAK